MHGAVQGDHLGPAVAHEPHGHRGARRRREATGQPPEIPAAAIAWLVAGSPDAVALAGTEVVAARVVADHGLLDPGVTP